DGAQAHVGDRAGFEDRFEGREMHAPPRMTLAETAVGAVVLASIGEIERREERDAAAEALSPDARGERAEECATDLERARELRTQLRDRRLVGGEQRLRGARVREALFVARGLEREHRGSSQIFERSPP